VTSVTGCGMDLRLSFPASIATAAPGAAVAGSRSRVLQAFFSGIFTNSIGSG
jgi:hypothetical protein